MTSGQEMEQSILTTPEPAMGTFGISPVSEMTYTVSSGTLNPSIPYHWHLLYAKLCVLLHQLVF